MSDQVGQPLIDIRLERPPEHVGPCECAWITQDWPGQDGTMDGKGSHSPRIFVDRSKARDVAAKLLAFAEDG